MFFSDSIFKPQTSNEDLQTIAKLNRRRSTFIYKRFNISMQMVKGILDYHGLTKDKFLWRFETVMNKEQQPQRENDQEILDMSATHLQSECKFYTPEQMYNNMPYLTDNIVKDKVDEIYNEIVSRDFQLEVKSMPYQNQKYIVQSLVNQPFHTPQAELAWKQSVFDALTKNTGFLRPVIYDKNNLYKTPNISTNKKGKYDLSWSQNTLDKEITTQIISVDPETVFIDPATDDPKECFIITPTELHELKVRFPFLSEYIADQDDLDPTIGSGGNIIDYPTIRENRLAFREQPYIYHMGEALLELYNSKDINDSIFGGIIGNTTTMGMSQPGPLVMTNGIFQAFMPGFGTEFWNNLFYQRNLPTLMKRRNYFVNEYYNVVQDLYVCWIGNVILYQGPILEPYKEIPLVPIYANKKNRGFYGEAFTGNLVQYQEEYNEIRHQQRLISKLLGKPTLMVDDSKISDVYHPNKQIVLADYQPFTIIHANNQDNALVENIGVPVTPLNLNYGSDNILEARKARLMAEMEKKYPNIKALTMNSNPEMQREIIWSRDLNVNVMLQALSLSFSQLAAKVFATRIFELKASVGSGLPVPSFENSSQSILLMIEDTQENLLKTQEKVQQAFDQIYQQQVVKTAQAIVADGKTLPALQQQVMQQILQQVLQGLGQMGNDQSQQSDIMQAAMQNPQVMATVQDIYNKEGKEKIQELILQQAESQVQRPVDNNMYLSFEMIDNIYKIQKEFEFSFKKSIKEQQAAMQTFLQMATPLQNLLPQILQPKGFLEQLCIMQGLDPTQIIRDKVPAPEDMIQQQNTKMYFGADKNPTIAADFYNKLRGEQVVTKDNILQDYQIQKQIDTQAIIAQNQSKMQDKAKAEIAVNDAKPAENNLQNIPQINQNIPSQNLQNNQVQNTPNPFLNQ